MTWRPTVVDSVRLVAKQKPQHDVVVQAGTVTGASLQQIDRSQPAVNMPAMAAQVGLR